MFVGCFADGLDLTARKITKTRTCRAILGAVGPIDTVDPYWPLVKWGVPPENYDHL